jgi:serine protease Do
MKKIFGLALLAFAASAATIPAGARKPARSNVLADYSAAMQRLARTANPAVVQILVRTLAPVGKDELQQAGFVSEQDVSGSGVIVDPDGYIVTNAHVVQSARHIQVKLLRRDQDDEEPHGHLLPATLIGLDKQVDIAVIKIEGANLPKLSFMDSDTLRQGQLVLAVGSPLGLQNSLTHGVVSSVSRQLSSESPMVYVQTDAPINPGNSGGPLLDIKGRITGINTMIYSESGGNEGIGFAIPANLAKETYQKLRQNGRIRRGSMGVIPQTITPTLASGLGLSRDWGVILSDVASHGPADAAGIQQGDIVLSVDGKPMRQARDLGLAVFHHAPGDELNLDIQRGEDRMSKTVVLVDRQKDTSQLEDLASYDSSLIRQLGILAVTLDEQVLAILPNLRRFSGVAVAAVPAEYAGLNPGLVGGDVIYAVNGKSVDSLDALREALKSRKAGDSIVFLVERSGQLIYVSGNLEQ